MPFALRELRHAASRKRIGLLFVAVTGLFIVTGPFGTSEHLRPASRALYWFAVHAGTWSIAVAAILLVARSGGRLGRHPVVRLVLATALAAVPITAVVLALNLLFFGDVSDTPSFAQLLEFTVPITLLINVISAASASVPVPVAAGPAGAVAEAATPEASDVPGGGARFLSRLPAHLGRDLRYLAMRDHYVEAVTARGSTLVLMRMADAIAELDGMQGYQIHRSYWVATGAVRRLSRDGERLFVDLDGDARLPVARARQAEIRAAFAGLDPQRG